MSDGQYETRGGGAFVEAVKAWDVREAFVLAPGAYAAWWTRLSTAGLISRRATKRTEDRLLVGQRSQVGRMPLLRTGA